MDWMSDRPLFPELPVLHEVSPRPRVRRRGKALLLHLLRLGILVAVLALIHRAEQRHQSSQPGAAADIPASRIRDIFPGFDHTRHGGDRLEVLDSDGNVLGFAILTSPAGDRVIGFSGPTTVLLAFDPQAGIVSARIVASRDTQEHVELIERHPEFLNQWVGLTWDEAARGIPVDGVSGATLTSLAVADAISVRLGGQAPNLRFPEPVAREELQRWWPDADRLEVSGPSRTPQPVVASDGRQPGFVLRSTPAADSVIGYQGPTDTLMAFDPDLRLLGFALRRSFDNEPYVDYVREDAWFQKAFRGRTLDELAALDLREAGVEGVSGATMTSQAVAQAVVTAAAAAREAPATETRPDSISPRGRDAGSAAVLAVGLLVGLTGLRRHRRLRLLTQCLMIGVLGLLNGDLLSQAVLAGWAQHGVPWRLAMGLSLVAAVAFVFPATTRTQPYCHHLCPHGMAQQLLHRRLPWQVMPRGRVRRCLLLIPFALLAWMITIAVLHLPFSLVDLEPFDAYVVRAAGTATIAIAVGGLVAALFIPMAYCRYGCPTGVVLEFVRYNSGSDRWTGRDWLATLLLLLAVILNGGW